VTTDPLRVHRPGDDAMVIDQTSDPAGGAAEADIVVRAVDQKLYDMGLAGDDDPVDKQCLAAGRSDLSHRLPANTGAPAALDGRRHGGGELATTSGIVPPSSVRGSDGTALSDHLADDITSWRVAALAVTGSCGWARARCDPGRLPAVEPVAPDTVSRRLRPGIVRARGRRSSQGDSKSTSYAPTLPGRDHDRARVRRIAWLTGSGATLRSASTGSSWRAPRGRPPARCGCEGLTSGPATRSVTRTDFVAIDDASPCRCPGA
jgi:hypothetical protein